MPGWWVDVFSCVFRRRPRQKKRGGSRSAGPARGPCQ
jgi:hypothetical protein